jgi:zinc protease
VLIAHKPNTPQTTLMVAQIGTPRAHPDYERLDVMNQVLGGLFSSRINMNLREKHGYTYGAFSSLHENREGGPFTIVTSVRADVTGDSVRQILKEVEGMLSAPVSAAELRSAKESITRTLPAYFQSTASAAATFGQLYLLGLPPDYYQGLAGRIESLTAEQIAAVTREHVRFEQLKVIAVGDRETIEAQLVELDLGRVGHRDLEGEALVADERGVAGER